MVLHRLTFQLNVSLQAQYYHIFSSLKKGRPDYLYPKASKKKTKKKTSEIFACLYKQKQSLRLNTKEYDKQAKLF